MSAYLTDKAVIVETLLSYFSQNDQIKDRKLERRASEQKLNNH